MLESGSIQGSEATAKHRSHALFARGHLEAAVQCPALSATVEVAHTTSRLGDERHMLLECPALADLRDECSPFNDWLQSAQVSWLGLCGPETSLWSAGTSLLALIECHADERQTLFHPFSLVGCQG